MPRSWPGPTYEVRVDFRAPLEFVYRWCTDFTPEDPQYEAATFQRRILRKSKRLVVYEDLEDINEGWRWARHVVRLLPPNRWHSDSVGTHRDIDLDYRLSSLPGERTRLLLTARRRPTSIGQKNPPKSQWERDIRQDWEMLGRSLEREYRAKHKRKN